MTQKAILEHAIVAGHRSVDLLLGDDAYKRRWSTGFYDTLGVVAAGSSPALAAGRALLALGSTRRRLRLGLKAAEPSATPQRTTRATPLA